VVLLEQITKKSSVKIGGYPNRQTCGLFWVALLEMLLDSIWHISKVQMPLASFYNMQSKATVGTLQAPNLFERRKKTTPHYSI
jgi:hypothetical protein